MQKQRYLHIYAGLAKLPLKEQEDKHRLIAGE